MSLTHCPDCRRLCFVTSEYCPSCEASFRPGELRDAAAAEEKSFMRTGNAMFLASIASALAVLGALLMRA